MALLQQSRLVQTIQKPDKLSSFQMVKTCRTYSKLDRITFLLSWTMSYKRKCFHSHLKTRPFGFRTKMDHSKSLLVRFSDVDCSIGPPKKYSVQHIFTVLLSFKYRVQIFKISTCLKVYCQRAVATHGLLQDDFLMIENQFKIKNLEESE